MLQKSDRVKCIDFHPVEPWALLCMFSGKVIVYDLEKNGRRMTTTFVESMSTNRSPTF